MATHTGNAEQGRVQDKRLRPFCRICWWRKGGIDSWDGKACKCGFSAPPEAELMRRATKGEVTELARKVLGLGASAGARRSFTTYWIVEVRDPSGRIVHTADEKSLASAYGDCATWLRGRQLEAA